MSNLDTLLKYKNEFNDYYTLENDGGIIARDKNGLYAWIYDNKFLIDGERIPKNNMYRINNSTLEKKYISDNEFKKI